MPRLLRHWWGSTAKNDYVLPVIASLCAVVLASVGYWISQTGPSRLVKLALFSLITVVLLHAVYWACRRVTTDKAIRTIDYVYLTIAFFGIYGVLDIQANLIQLQASEIRDSYTFDLDDLRLCERAIEKPPEMVCDAEKAVRGYLQKPYDFNSHRDLFFVLLMVDSPFTDLIKATYLARYERVLSQVRALHKEMQDKVFQYVDPEEDTVLRRMFGFYVLSIGLAVRFTKVSSEVFSWKIPTPKLPKHPRGAANSVWLRRALRRKVVP